MQVFFTYLSLGFKHITDLSGYDHMLFVLALCTPYSLENWKKVLSLITTFTVGHSIALALAVFKLVNIESSLVEFLIPLTIFISAFINLTRIKPKYTANASPGSDLVSGLLLVSFFGLIHGLGFSNYLQSLLGQEQSIFWPLLSFNIGLEIGQILIIAAIFVFTTLLTHKLSVKRRDLIIGLSCLVLGLSINLIIEKWIF
jgi:hydrogenase/urease accessory protein HupE